MLAKLREPFGKAGLIVAIVALVAALTGGAYAAGGGLSGKEKKEVKSIAKSVSKPGKNGQNGANGAVGPQGLPGAAGLNGKDGTNGANGVGTPGADGKSVIATPIASGEPTACEEQGGVELEVEESGEPGEICNGHEGSPWAVGGLPKGATETGSWVLSGSEASADEQGIMYVPISIPIPLSAPLHEADIHLVKESGDSTCTGSYTKPTAPEGTLCLYYQREENAEIGYVASLEGEPNELSPAGGYLVFFEVKDHAWARGSFAVTGK